MHDGSDRSFPSLRWLSCHALSARLKLQSLVQWKFQPAFRDGVPVDTVILVPFQLRREGGGITVDLRKMPVPSRRTVS